MCIRDRIADWRIADWNSLLGDFVPSDPPESPLSRADSESPRKNAAELTPRELRGPMLRLFLGPRSS
eukprot:6632100-Alexandrium_andersonii.AAC.1